MENVIEYIIFKFLGRKREIELPDRKYIIYYKNLKVNRIKEDICSIIKNNMQNKKINLSNEIKEKIKQKNNVKLIEKIEENNLKNKEIMKKYLENIIEKLLNIKNKKMQEINIYILIKAYSGDIYKQILELNQKYKTVNIVTNDINRFRWLQKKIEDSREDEITITNNRKKSLKRAEYIINIDFDNKDINSFSINPYSVIFNLSKNKIENILGFNGIIINNVSINVNKLDLINLNNIEKRYNINNIYEEEMLKNSKVIEQIEYSFIGNRGILSQKEILKNA